MKRSDLKPGDVFYYDGSDSRYTRSVDWCHPAGPEPRWGISERWCASMDHEVVVVWAAPETQAEYDARTGTTRHTMPAVTTQAHYTELTPEPIDVIQSWGLGFHLGNVVKYVARHGRKPGVDGVEDLKKARAYLSREIARLEGRNAWE